jgi:glycosyltransferase involved in cell wall biosynthesis
VLKCASALAAIGHHANIFTLSVPQNVRKKVPSGVTLHEVEDVAERVESGTLPAALAAAAMGGTQAHYKLVVGALLCDALRAEHLANPFDIVEAAECEGLALPLLVRPIHDLPVVVQIHLGYAANAFGNGLAEAERDHLAEGLELATIVGADAVCAATRSVVEVTRQLCPFERDVEIIPYPVDVAARENSQAPPDGAALFVGRLQRRKGCDVLAAAADIFLRRNPAATVRVAGSDTKSRGTSMLAEMLERLDPAVRDRFVYLGECSQAQVHNEIEACRFQVVPSVVENFANTAIDAMARGRAVIYGGNTGLDEVVGDAGIRVFPLTAEGLAEKMELALRDADLVRQCENRGLERIRARFDAGAISRHRIEFFQRAIAAHRAGKTGDRQWQALSGPQIRAVLTAWSRRSTGRSGCSRERLHRGFFSPPGWRNWHNGCGDRRKCGSSVPAVLPSGCWASDTAGNRPDSPWRESSMSIRALRRTPIIWDWMSSRATGCARRSLPGSSWMRSYCRRIPWRRCFGSGRGALRSSESKS